MSVTLKTDWLVYCNATRDVGLGHLARCLGYAEALIQHGQTVQFLGQYSLFAESMIQAINMPFENLGEFVQGSIDECFQCFSVIPERGLLIDSYTLLTDDLALIRERFVNQRIVLLDDFGDRPEYFCDAIVNFTVGADLQMYPVGLETFLGPRFYPARSWVREAREERLAMKLTRFSNNFDRWLLICGGTDFSRFTYRLVDTLATCVPNAKVCVLLANGVDVIKLERKLQAFVEYEIIQPTTNLKEAFVWADACICGGGLTKYECLFSGMPVVSFSQTPGQQLDTECFVRFGLIEDLGPAYMSTDELPIEAFFSCFNSLSSVPLRPNLGQAIFGAGDVQTVLQPFDLNKRHK